MKTSDFKAAIRSTYAPPAGLLPEGGGIHLIPC